jgi:tetratricopeptide (TPR) repeat protein
MTADLDFGGETMDMKTKASKLWTVLYLIAICSSPIMALSSSAATREFQEGIASYQSGNYTQAAAYFKLACAKEPASPDAHYYYANTLAYLRDGRNAIIEYQNCLRSHPSGVEAEYARAALEAYNAQIPISQTYSPQMEARSLPGALEQTFQQAERLANRVAFADGTSIDNMQDSGSTYAADISQAGIQTVSDMESAYVTGPAGSCDRQPVYSAAEIEEARQYYANYAASVQQATATGTRLAQQNLADKERKLQNTIANLQDQLATPMPSNGGVRLSPVGTNLYIRNYQ